MDAAHAAVIQEVERTSANEVQLDVDLTGASASVQTVKKGWTITAYAQRLWTGTKKAGLRVSRPLGLFSGQ